MPALRDLRQERAEPHREPRHRKETPHQVRLGDTWRQEVLPRGLVVQRAGAVLQVERLAALADEPLELRVLRRARVVEDEPERERRLVVLALADRIRELREPVDETAPDRGFERRERGGERARLRIVPLPQLRGELEEPCEPVRALEGRAPLRQDIARLGGHLLGRQAPRQRLAGRLAERRRGIRAGEPREEPVSVHRRVPVVAPEERGRELTRGPHVGVRLEGVRDLARILLADAVEREAREASRRRFGQLFRAPERHRRESETEQGRRPHRAG